MNGRTVRTAAAVLLVCTAFGGCLGVLGDAEGVTVGKETGTDGTTFVYVASTDGEPLPADTRISVNSTLPGAQNFTTTLGRQVSAGTRIYPGGVLTSESAADLVVGAPPPTSNVPRPLYYEVTVTVTVDTGDANASRTFTFGG